MQGVDGTFQDSSIAALIAAGQTSKIGAIDVRRYTTIFTCFSTVLGIVAVLIYAPFAFALIRTLQKTMNAMKQVQAPGRSVNSVSYNSFIVTANQLKSPRSTTSPRPIDGNDSVVAHPASPTRSYRPWRAYRWVCDNLDR